MDTSQKTLCWHTYVKCIIQSQRKNPCNLFKCNKFHMFSYFFQEYRIWHFMQMGSIGDNLHEMSNCVFWEKIEKIGYFNLPSAEKNTQSSKCLTECTAKNNVISTSSLQSVGFKLPPNLNKGDTLSGKRTYFQVIMSTFERSLISKEVICPPAFVDNFFPTRVDPFSEEDWQKVSALRKWLKHLAFSNLLLLMTVQ